MTPDLMALDLALSIILKTLVIVILIFGLLMLRNLDKTIRSLERSAESLESTTQTFEDITRIARMLPFVGRRRKK